MLILKQKFIYKPYKNKDCARSEQSQKSTKPPDTCEHEQLYPAYPKKNNRVQHIT